MSDLLKRAAHTFWQTFVATVLVVTVASLADVSKITDVASAKKFGLSLAAAIVAAALSAVKTTLAQYKSGNSVIDTGPGSTE